MTDLQQNKTAAKAMVQGYVLEQVGKGRELPEWEVTAVKFTRIAMDWIDEFIDELLDAGLILPTVIQDGDRFDAGLRAA